MLIATAREDTSPWQQSLVSYAGYTAPTTPTVREWMEGHAVTEADLSRIQSLLDRGDSLDASTARTLVTEVRRLRAIVGEHLTVTIRPITQEGTDPSQAWFWTPEWQAGERVVDEQIAAGKVRRFDDVEALIADLTSE